MLTYAFCVRTFTHIEYIVTRQEHMKKRQIHARLIEQNSNFSQFARKHGYEPRTVTQVVTRWAGMSTLPRGRLSFRILRDLSREIGREISPGLLREDA